MYLRGHLVACLFSLLNVSDTIQYILFPIHHSELRHPPQRPNPSCRHVEPRWKFHFSPSPTHTVAMCRHTTAKDRWCGKEVPQKTREKDETSQEGERERKTEQNKEKDEGKARGIKKRCCGSLQEWRKVNLQTVLWKKREKRRRD